MTKLTNIDDLMSHLHADMTAKELGAVVISLVAVKPRGIRQRLALAARDRLGKNWTDRTVRQWLAPSSHSEGRAERNREAVQRWFADPVNARRGRENHQRWRTDNAEHIRGYWRDYCNQRNANDPAFRLANNLRSRVRATLRGLNKSARTMQLVGCSIDELRVHLERQFQLGMSWENLGAWEIDHIRPCASFDLSDPEQQRECFGWRNLQPLWASENTSKGSLFEGVRHRYG